MGHTIFYSTMMIKLIFGDRSIGNNPLCCIIVIFMSSSCTNVQTICKSLFLPSRVKNLRKLWFKSWGSTFFFFKQLSTYFRILLLSKAHYLFLT